MIAARNSALLVQGFELTAEGECAARAALPTPDFEDHVFAERHEGPTGGRQGRPATIEQLVDLLTDSGNDLPAPLPLAPHAHGRPGEASGFPQLLDPAGDWSDAAAAPLPAGPPSPDPRAYPGLAPARAPAARRAAGGADLEVVDADWERHWGWLAWASRGRATEPELMPDAALYGDDGDAIYIVQADEDEVALPQEAGAAGGAVAQQGAGRAHSHGGVRPCGWLQAARRSAGPLGDEPLPSAGVEAEQLRSVDGADGGPPAEPAGPVWGWLERAWRAGGRLGYDPLPSAGVPLEQSQGVESVGAAAPGEPAGSGVPTAWDWLERTWRSAARLGYDPLPAAGAPLRPPRGSAAAGRAAPAGPARPNTAVWDWLEGAWRSAGRLGYDPLPSAGAAGVGGGGAAFVAPADGGELRYMQALQAAGGAVVLDRAAVAGAQAGMSRGDPARGGPTEEQGGAWARWRGPVLARGALAEGQGGTLALRHAPARALYVPPGRAAAAALAADVAEHGPPFAGAAWGRLRAWLHRMLDPPAPAAAVRLALPQPYGTAEAALADDNTRSAADAARQAALLATAQDAVALAEAAVAAAGAAAARSAAGCPLCSLHSAALAVVGRERDARAAAALAGPAQDAAPALPSARDPGSPAVPGDAPLSEALEAALSAARRASSAVGAAEGDRGVGHEPRVSLRLQLLGASPRRVHVVLRAVPRVVDRLRRA